MTPTEALAALVAVLDAEHTAAPPDLAYLELSREELAPLLTQAQAVLAQPEIVRYYDPELGDTRSGVLTPDRTTWPTREAIFDAVLDRVSVRVANIVSDAILPLLPTPEALAERIVSAYMDETASGPCYVPSPILRALILRAIQETPR